MHPPESIAPTLNPQKSTRTWYSNCGRRNSTAVYLGYIPKSAVCATYVRIYMHVVVPIWWSQLGVMSGAHGGRAQREEVLCPARSRRQQGDSSGRNTAGGGSSCYYYY